MITGELRLPPIKGHEIYPGVTALSDPVMRPDLGPCNMAVLADVDGVLCVVELSIRLKQAAEQ